MDYRERAPCERLTGLVKTFWWLDAGGSGDEWIEHQATPDGCIELIWRLKGRSRWNGDQPEKFAVGLSDSPVCFEISGDASFVAIRLWPWTWHTLSGISPMQLYGRWLAVENGRVDHVLSALADPQAAETMLVGVLGHARSLADMGMQILAAGSVAEMSRRTCIPSRRLQRWFAHHVGLAPRNYLRLLRFQHAFEALPNAGLLADHAAEHGFSDQAHMAREFRRLAGKAASHVRAQARGPFLS